MTKTMIKPAYLLLAGGQSRRMGGGDKNLMLLGGQPILTHVLARVTYEFDSGDVAVPPMMLNANGDPSRYGAYDLPIVRDVIDGYAGPLAGILTGLEWMRDNHPECTHLISFATDAPFIPVDLSRRLMAAVVSGAEMAQAASKGRRHPVFAIWPIELASKLRQAVITDGIRKIDDFTTLFNCAIVDFDNSPDPFMNLNRPEDFDEAAKRL